MRIAISIVILSLMENRFLLIWTKNMSEPKNKDSSPSFATNQMKMKSTIMLTLESGVIT